MKNTIEDHINTRKNNFDFIRFVAAVLVVFYHSFPLSLGDGLREPLMIVTHNQMTFATFGVYAFFIISGFLITQSCDKSKDFIDFAKARILRIYPALIVVTIFAIILGSMVTPLSLNEYFQNSTIYRYFIFAFTLNNSSMSLPGVFVSNIWGSLINGSLWTLKYEFSFYILVGILGLTKLLRLKSTLIIFELAFISFIFVNLPVFRFLSFFSIGMLFYFARKYIPLNYKLATISFICLVIGCFVGYFDHIFVVCGSYLVFYFAFNKKIKLSNWAKHGDFSYGIYIYAFPIQQTVTHLFGGRTEPVINFACSIPPIMFCAFLSWHLVEKVALRHKHKKLPLSALSPSDFVYTDQSRL